MTICEKVAYIKGLAEGLDLDSNDKNSKVLKAIIELLEDVALTVEDLEDGCAELCEQRIRYHHCHRDSVRHALLCSSKGSRHPGHILSSIRSCWSRACTKFR